METDFGMKYDTTSFESRHFFARKSRSQEKVVLYREFEKWLLLGPTRMAKWSLGCLQQKESSVREERKGR